MNVILKFETLTGITRRITCMAARPRSVRACDRPVQYSSFCHSISNVDTRKKPLPLHQHEIRVLLSGETDVTIAQIALLFEDVDGKLSRRSLIQDGSVILESFRGIGEESSVGQESTSITQIFLLRRVRISNETRADSRGEYPQARVIGAVYTITPELISVRTTSITLLKKIPWSPENPGCALANEVLRSSP